MKEIVEHPSNRTKEAEEELLRGCQAGDPACFEVLIRSHLRMVLSIACKFTHEFSEAEDLCQEIMTKVVRSISGFRGQSKVRTWIYSMAVAHCIDDQRRRAVMVSEPIENVETLSAPRDQSPEAVAISAERAVAVHAAVNSLPEELKTVVLLYDFENLPQKEIAEQVGIPEGTVWSRLHKARTVLRTKLSHLLRG